MSKVLKLEQVTEDDFDFIWKLYSESVSHLLSPYLANGWDEQKEKINFQSAWSKGKTYLIYLGDEKIGWISGEERETDLLIENGFIIPTFRRKGIGSKLLLELQNAFQKKNKSVTISVLKDNPASTFFDKFSFELLENNSITKTIRLIN